MTVERLIERLDKPKRTGSGTWIARCPAHQDRSPSLTIRETEDGRVLLKCHAECPTENVLSAVGLTFSDLYPEKALGDRLPPLRRPFPAADVLEAVMGDMLTVQQVAASIQRDGQVTPHQRALLQQAVARVTTARDLVNG